LYYDDESTPARGAQLAERLISQDGVQFVLGAYSSGLTKAIAPATEKYKVPHVEGNGAARELSTQGYRYLFAVLSTSDYYLRDAGRPPDRGDEDRGAHRRHHPLRLGQDRREPWQDGGAGPLRFAVGPQAELQGQVVRQRRRLREALREGIQVSRSVPGGGIDRVGARLRRCVRAGEVVRSRQGARRHRSHGSH